jgi:hypothetical protein
LAYSCIDAPVARLDGQKPQWVSKRADTLSAALLNAWLAAAFDPLLPLEIAV